MERRILCSAVWGVLVTCLWPMGASAGSVGADLPESEVGDLRLAGVAVSKQTWTLQSDGIELELELAAPTAGPLQGRLVLVAGEKSDFESWARLLAQYPQQAPKQPEFRVAGQPIRVEQKRERVSDGDWLREELVFTLPAAQAGQRVVLSWGTPRAGGDGIPLQDKAFLSHYCIDAGTAKALKKADGYVSQHLRLSAPAYAGQQGVVIVRVDKPSADLPVSLCADGVKKTSRTQFEVKLPTSAPFLPVARGGRRLPVLFGLRI